MSINSAAIAGPELIGEIANRFGSQAVVVAIDGKRGPSAGGVGGGLRMPVDAKPPEEE